MPAAPYWQISESALLSSLNSSRAGLSASKVLIARSHYGFNHLQASKEKPLILDYLSRFTEPLVLILVAASGVSALLGQVQNFIIISFMVFLSATLSFVQERRAHLAAAKLRRQVETKTSCLRDGQFVSLSAHELVPGDIICLSAGQVVPADCRILKSNDLLVNQSSLTGEGFPVEKDSHPYHGVNSSPANIRNCLFMGTNLVHGDSLAVVVNTGTRSQFGQLVIHASKKRSATAYEIGMRKFGFLLMKFTLFLVLVVFFVNFANHITVLDSFLFALSLAVGLTPELLPVVLTVNLSRGAKRMASRGAIVKSLTAIENIGGMKVLCTDKTGTLTQDQIALEKYVDVYGKQSSRVLEFGLVNAHFQAGLRSPMEEAILTHQEIPLDGWSKIDEIAFDFNRKRLSVVAQKGAKIQLISKGAAEMVLDQCNRYFSRGMIKKISPAIKSKIIGFYEEYSRDGFRVLAVAYKTIKSKKDYTPKDEYNLIFLGLMAFLDPPKPSTADALHKLALLGVETKILTGDSEIVTRHVCEQIGLPIKGVVMGDDLDQLSQSALLSLVKANTIFARLTPTQKEQIILALKSSGEGVGFLGDGINDAPALNAADVGISVDNAVDVAKDSADIILVAKDLHLLYDGLEEGRRTFGNVTKYVNMATSSNFGNMFSMAAASFALPFLPMLPIQILVNNFLYDISQVFLSGDRVDTSVIKQRSLWRMDHIRRFMIFFGPLSSIFDFLTFFFLFKILKSDASLFHTGWFTESLVTQTMIIFSIRTAHPFLKSRPSNLLLVGAIGIILFTLSLPYSPLGKYLLFVPLPVSFYLFLALVVTSYFTLSEILKRIYFNRFSQSD